MLKFALIIGSTRPNRFADKPAEWIVEGAKARDDFQLDVLDLKDANLPFMLEQLPPAMIQGAYDSPEANAWRERIAAYDGYIVTAAEYNFGPTAVLKNALDSAYAEWLRKPIAFVGYGSVGGSRAIQQLRNSVIQMQMAPICQEVNIAGEVFMNVWQHGKSLNDYPFLAGKRTALFDNLVWWGKALKAARAA